MDTIFGQIGSNLNQHFSSSVNVVVDINYLILSCPCATFSLLLSTDFNSYYFVYGKLFIINLVDTVVDMLLSCGLWMLFYFKLSVQSFVEAEGYRVAAEIIASLRSSHGSNSGGLDFLDHNSVCIFINLILISQLTRSSSRGYTY